MHQERAGKKLALFLPFMGGGGAERVMLNLAIGFAAQGVAVDLVLAKAKGEYLEQVPATVRIIDLNARRVLTSLPGLIRYLRRERPHAMLSTLMHANILALIARRLAGVPVRLIVREAVVLSENLNSGGSSFNFFFTKTAFFFMVRHIYSWADGIIAVSRGVADDFIQTLRLPQGRVEVAENPIVTSELHREAEETVDHPWFEQGAPPVILGAGRLEAQKDFPTLIKAFALVRDKFPARLVILGEGQDRPSLQSLINELRLEKDVELPGFVKNPFKYMARSSVFVLSSRYEGLPGTLIQAMAVGTPVVSTNCKSGPDEILGGGIYGKIVSVGDVEAMAWAILTELKEKDERAEKITKGKERAGLFTIEKSLEKYASMLFPH